jgi:riboflavin kinase/FMN adenylyltransferase
MQLVRSVAELKHGMRKVCVSLGFFDGVHLGHQQIIRHTIADARQHEALALVITFDQHPNTIVAPARVPPLIYSLPQKLRQIELMQVDALLLLNFDKPFSLQTGDGFIRSLARDLGQLQSICVGANFTFGHKRSGNVDLLRKLGGELNFNVHGIASVSLDGKTISSTRIREAIAAGRLEEASQMLGRAYSLSGEVIRGEGLGRKLGFPTANINTHGLVLPPQGVYAVRGVLDEGSYGAVLNIGFRPTLQNPKPHLQVEAHLLDFSADLYGQSLEIVFVEKLREEVKFDSLDALRQQIAKDIVEARRRF